MEDVKKKFRKHIRLKGFDYGSGHYYFVTICTRDWRKLFAPFVDLKWEHVVPKDVAARLVSGGESDWKARFTSAVAEKLDQLPSYYPNVSVDFYTIMPDHVHSIIAINDVAAAPCAAKGNQVSKGDEGRHTVPQLQEERKVKLPTVINAFKSLVTRRIKDLGYKGDSLWQPNYYEHIIRSESSLDKIRTYILRNPWVEYEEIDWRKLDPS